MIEEFSRFVFNPDYVRSDGSVAKEAFMPPPNTKPYEVSVVAHDADCIDWDIAFYLEDLREKRNQRLVECLGSAEFNEFAPPEAELIIDPSPSKDIPRHANLKGWDMFNRSRLEMQMETMAQFSTFVSRPERRSPVVINIPERRISISVE